MRGAAALGLFVGFASTVGCASLPAAPTRLPKPAQSPQGLASDPPPRLLLQPGDVLDVGVRSADLTTGTHSAVVEGDGSLFVPGAGAVRAAELSLSDAEQAVTQLLQRRDRFANAHLVLRTPVGQRVTVLGAVLRQGPVQLVPGMRVADVIVAAGGLLSVRSPVDNVAVPLADLTGAVVVRDGQALPISLAQALRGHPAHNVHIHAGDHIFVPLAGESSIRVMGQVRAAAVFAAAPRLRLTQALSRAGGITQGGDRSDIRLVRGPVERPQVFVADVSAIVAGNGPDVELAPGDFVFVTDDPLEDFGEVLGVLAPLLAVTSAAAFTALILTL